MTVLVPVPLTYESYDTRTHPFLPGLVLVLVVVVLATGSTSTGTTATSTITVLALQFAVGRYRSAVWTRGVMMRSWPCDVPRAMMMHDGDDMVSFSSSSSTSVLAS
jgi:hypothetical protein